jgi:hypothetical protein
MEKTLTEIIAEREAKAEQGNWLPACGGTETPFMTRTGLRLLYCYQPSTGRHAYINCSTDIILSDSEASAALAT